MPAQKPAGKEKMAEDYYATLGVSRSASAEEIKRAYRQLARKFHPDVSKDAGASEKFKKINEAYSVLSDDSKRAQYDRFGPDQPGSTQSAQWRDFSGFESSGLGDIFETFFGGASPFSFGEGMGNEGRPRARNIRYPMTITLEEAFKGASKGIRVKRRDLCPECRGEGGFSPARCGECGGTGRIARTRRTMIGLFQTFSTCPECRGRGERFSRACSRCRGEGEVSAEHDLTVEVPAGVDSGTTLSLSGEGEAGGDLYVLINVAEHKLFRRDGADLIYPVRVSFAQAALGGEIVVPALDGDVSVELPEGTQTGEELRIARRGMPSLRGRGRGDIVVEVTVATPTRLSQRQKDLLREFDGLQQQKKKGLFGL